MLPVLSPDQSSAWDQTAEAAGISLATLMESAGRACAAVLRASYEAGETRTLIDARVNLLPYQIEPALAILRGEATRVLLADEVGLLLVHRSAFDDGAGGVPAPHRHPHPAVQDELFRCAP